MPGSVPVPAGTVGSCHRGTGRPAADLPRPGPNHRAELGELQRVRVRHDSKFPLPGWYLDRICVRRNEGTNQEWTLPCNRWLAQDEDDGEIERVLDRA
ncbi:PLAT/LH2 domain-containing protein [Streptomyces sp. NPDC054940]